MSMIWLEERLNDDVKLPAFETLLESAYLSLPAVDVVTPMSALAVGCVVFCAGTGESGVCPFALVPPANKNVNTDAATKTAICDTRAPSREGQLGVAFTASSIVENCGMRISFYNLNLRNLARRRVMGSSVNCHSFVVRPKAGNQEWLMEERGVPSGGMLWPREFMCCLQRNNSHM
jgi:hypothetical protein